MSNAVTRILRRAAGEIGYSRWSDPKRGTKYARETQPALWPRDTWLLANGISYCDIFVTWVFWKEGLLDILPAGASYNTDYRASKGGRVPRSQARPGDVLVFDWNWSTLSTNHVGILEKVLPSGNFQTIEGNTSVGSAGSQSNGGRVARRVRRPGQVRYVIRPRWGEVTGVPSGGASAAVPKPAPKPAPKLTEDGRLGTSTVKALQTALGVKADGRACESTWKALQRKVGTFVDGVVSNQSYRAKELGNGVVDRCWRFTGRGSKGSKMVVALQKKLGVKADGIWYESTTLALQKALNAGRF